MNDSIGMATNSRHLTAFFDTRADAEEAVARLREIGLSDGSVRMTGGEEFSAPAAAEPKGFWESISDFLMSDDDSATYAEGLRRGGYLVTVSDIPEESFDAVLDILDDEGSVDLDERSESWRAEGWQGTSAGAALGAGTSAGAEGGAAPDLAYGTHDDVAKPALVGDDGLTGDAGASVFGRETETAALRSGTDAEVIPVVEERLRVGKRDMNLGRVRVRSYVVEEPVSEQVSLRADRVEIERRPVDRALDAGDAAFVDRTIEAEERAEEAVIQKEARVVEEIGLRKTSDERTETISDTVRRTEVEVEDERDETRGAPRNRDV
jgi:uncharacterized protein (TIGR02271 family)